MYIVHYYGQLIDIGVKCTHYYTCCRDGVYQANERCWRYIRMHQKQSRKLGGVCISRIYGQYHDNYVRVTCLSAHTWLKLQSLELKFLPLSESTKEEVSRN